MPKLGVNIDHVATLRQARGGCLIDPLEAALVCEQAGADSIVAHLREDRRHIQDRDAVLLSKKIRTKFNLEMAIAPEIVKIACVLKPYQATLVPERRKELTTEGGLNVAANLKAVSTAVKKMKACGIKVSLFIDPEIMQIDAASQSGAKIIELHTGRYSAAKRPAQIKMFLNQLKTATRYALNLGFTVNAGHGLDYKNVKPVAAIKGINELNIGYAVICRAIYTGLFKATKEMKELVKQC
jgi:pyridoxine 5-phosphate synthase